MDSQTAHTHVKTTQLYKKVRLRMEVFMCDHIHAIYESGHESFYSLAM